MQPRTCMLSAFTLTAALSFGSAAMAADLPKEGTFTATYSGAGTYKATSLGKERALGAFDENGLSVGTGLFDHMTWHCWGLFNITNGMGQAHGYCVATDPAGDQIAAEVGDEKHDVSKPFGVKGTFTMGTGRYAGISGGWTLLAHSPEFKTAEGSYVQYGTSSQGSYKLP